MKIHLSESEIIKKIQSSDFMTIVEELNLNQRYKSVAAKLRDDSSRYTRVEYEDNGQKTLIHRHFYLKLWPYTLVAIHHFEHANMEKLHNHPYNVASVITSGGYWETSKHGVIWRKTGDFCFTRAGDFHKTVLDPEKAGEETWSIVLFGPIEQEWGGFLSEQDWKEQLSVHEFQT